VKALPDWVWENDPEELPDDHHARCIAAHGERFLACGGHLFVLTTRGVTCRSSSEVGHGSTPLRSLQMEYLGLDWPRGLAQQFWGSEPFAGRTLDGEAQQAAGLGLLATVAGALGAGSVSRTGSGPPSQVGRDDFRLPLRPPGWPQRVRARCPLRPALLPLTVHPRERR
jgi:hypothetical protein